MEPHSLEWAVAVRVGVGQPLGPRDVGGELQDALVVDLAQLRHAIAQSLMRRPGSPGFLARTMLTYYIPHTIVAPPQSQTRAVPAGHIASAAEDFNVLTQMRTRRDTRSLEQSQQSASRASTSHERHRDQEGRHPPEAGRAPAAHAGRGGGGRAHADRLGRRRSRARGPAGHAAPRRGRLRGILFRLPRSTPPRCSPRPSRRPAATTTSSCCATSASRATASTTWRRSWAWRTSPTCPTAASSASPRSPAWWRSSPSACRRRRP